MTLKYCSLNPSFQKYIGDTRSLSNSEAQELKAWFKNVLSMKIKNVKVRITYQRIIAFIIALFFLKDNKQTRHSSMYTNMRQHGYVETPNKNCLFAARKDQ